MDLSWRLVTCLFSAAALFCAPVLAEESGKLVELINSYRESPGKCDSAELPAAGALAPDTALTRVKLTPGADLQLALKDAGYQAARAEAITVSGPSSPAAAMAAIKDRHCRALARPEYSAIGVGRNGDAWHIVLAQPLLAADLGDPFKAGRKVLELVNAARGKARTCGNKRFPAVPPLRWNEALAQSALAHSTDMANQNYFQHEGKNGSRVGERAQSAGYRWRRIGENIAAGHGSAQQTVAGWLSSPGHCSNIMSSNYIEMGAAYGVNSKSHLSIYWTLVVGAPG